MLDEFDRDVVVSRRRVLSGIAVLGAAGVIVPAGKPPKGTGNTPPDTEPTPSTTATSASSLTSESPPTAAAPPTSESDGGKEQNAQKPDLVLHGQFARLITPDGGGPSSSSADIVDDNGNPIGSFWSAAVAGGGSTTLFHTFQLDKGTLHGQGFGPLDEATFAVVGGTGAYEGARGQYVARQRPVAAGGDGTAEFEFAFLPGKG
jgi:hypothetical protein